MSRRPDLRTACANVLQVAFVSWIAVLAVAIAHGIAQRRLLDRWIDDPSSVSRAELASHAHRGELIVYIGFWLLLGTAVLFITWLFQQARRCQEAEAPQSFRPGWAIASWLIPFVCLVVPFEVTKDVWNSTADSDSSRRARGQMTRGRPFTVVHAWWMCLLGVGVLTVPYAFVSTWVVPAVLSFEPQSSFMARYSAAEQFVITGWLIARDVVLMVAAVLALLIVRRVSRGDPRLPGSAARATDGTVTTPVEVPTLEEERTPWPR